jgi:hypothetical protein
MPGELVQISLPRSFIHQKYYIFYPVIYDLDATIGDADLTGCGGIRGYTVGTVAWATT